MAIILAVGIALLPSLYAWFNIFANWDPYGSTGNMQVAVVIEDEGYQFRDITINVGEQIRSNLEANDLIDWQFVSKEEAVSGITSGKYYAGIEIPAGFSESLTSIVTDHFQQPQITYYANEKKNAIATKITDKVVQTVQQEVNESFVTTVINVISSLVNVVADATESGVAETFGDLQDKLSTASASIDTIQKSVDGFGSILTLSGTLNEAVSNNNLQEVLEKSDTLIASGADMTKVLQGSIGGITASVDTALEGIAKDLSDAAVLIDTAGTQTSGKADAAITAAQTELETLKTQLAAIHSALETVNQLTENTEPEISNFLTELETKTGKIDAALTAIEGKEELARAEAEQLAKDLSTVSQEITSLRTDFKETVAPAIKQFLSKTATTALDTVTAGLEETANLISDISEKTAEAAEMPLNEAETKLIKLRAQLQSLADLLGKVKSFLPLPLPVLDEFLNKLNGKIEKLDTILAVIAKAKDGSAQAQAGQIAKELTDLSDEIQTMRTDYQTEIQPILDDKLPAAVDTVLDGVVSGLDTASAKISGITADTAGTAEQAIANAHTSLTELQTRLQTIRETMDTVQQLFPSGLPAVNRFLTGLDGKIDKASALLSTLSGVREGTAKDKIDAAVADLNALSADINTLRTDYTTNVQPVIDENLTALLDMLSVTGALVTTLNGELPTIQAMADSLNSSMQSGEELISAIDTLLTNIKKQLDSLSGKLQEFGDSEILNTVKNIAGKNTDQIGAFLACPVIVNTDKIYGIENYGSAMAPFYSTLAIWVGAMILIAVVKTAVKRKKEIGDGKVRSVQCYFGRMLTFLLFSVVQALVICLGDLYFLNIQCYHPIRYLREQWLELAQIEMRGIGINF